MVRMDRVKRYSFRGSDIAADANGRFRATSSHSLNGELKAIQVLSNNYAAAGSLFLVVSGTGEVTWSLISGTVTSNVSVADVYLPMGAARNTQNVSLSGTAGDGIYTFFPIFGNLELVGSGLGANKSGTEINLAYI